MVLSMTQFLNPSFTFSMGLHLTTNRILATDNTVTVVSCTTSLPCVNYTWYIALSGCGLLLGVLL